jgi:hypothetical protein
MPYSIFTAGALHQTYRPSTRGLAMPAIDMITLCRNPEAWSCDIGPAATDA